VQDLDDDIIGDFSKEEILKFGFSTGNAAKFLKAFASTAAAPSGGAAAAGGGAAASATSLSAVSLSPTPCLDGGAVPAASDDPYALFAAAYGGLQAPLYPDQLLAAVRETTFAFCRKFRVGEAEAVRYFKEIQAEAMEHKHKLLDSIGCSHLNQRQAPHARARHHHRVLFPPQPHPARA
jgi:hypothetical protein